MSTESENVMYKLVMSTLGCLFLVGCGSGSDVGENVASNNSAVVWGSAIPTVEVNSAASIELENSTQYEWSVRATTGVGTGEWSSGLEFSIHASEDLALADAISRDDSVEYEPGLYSDALPVPTVVASSPIGSIYQKPNFRWEPVFNAVTYEVRILDVDSGTEVFTEYYFTQDVCQNDICELKSDEQAALLSPEKVTGTNTEGEITDTNNEAEVTDTNNQAEVTDTNREAEVTDTNNEAEVTDTNNEAEVTDTNNEAEITDANNEAEITDANNEAEITDSPTDTNVENQVSTETPELGEANEVQEPVEETAAPVQINVAENSEIEALQDSEGVLAFPGALGYAKHSVGGRGGRVVVVNTTNDIVNSSDNLMSLREATSVESGPRTIVFSVGGVFDTGTSELIMSGEADSNVTVACQSAPAPGVVIKTYGFSLQNGVHDLVFRHCGIRLISVNSTRAQAGRNITVRDGSRNIMLDHMSFAWATDENFQAYLGPGQGADIENVTVSNSAVVEGDADSAHPESVEHHSWFYHAMGPSCNNNNPSRRITGCSIVNNFIAHNATRNAMVWGGDGELKNNIIYNWYGIGLTVQPHGGGDVNAIVDNNLMKSGPNTKGGTSNPNCGPAQYRCAMYLGKTNSLGTSKFQVGDNYYIPENKTFDDVVLINHQNAVTPAGTPEFDSATDSPIPVLQMAALGSRFMSCVGASRPERDHIDTRVIQEFYDGTGSIGIGENVRDGGHNRTVQRTWHLYGPNTAHPAGYDTDNDGMPDEWENAYGLNPNNASDHSGDLDSDGYTNLEEYLAIAAHC